MQVKATWPDAIYAKHQVEGIEWMLKQEQQGYLVKSRNHDDYVVRGGILGDEMGLGKTIQSLALIINGLGVNTLIVCPLAVKRQALSPLPLSSLDQTVSWLRLRA